MSAVDRTSRSTGFAPEIAAGVAAVLFGTALYFIFVVAPTELQMGIVQKIFYFHVPSAYSMYLGFTVCAVASAVFLRTKSERADALALASAEVGALFSFMSLTSGPLWAKKAWGVFWVWDPRLTTTFLVAMIFVAYLALRMSADDVRGPERKFAAAIALFGVLNVPIIHYSVAKWGGQHPQVITGSGRGLAPDMKPALWIGFALFTCIAIAFIALRTRIETCSRDARSLAERLGIGDDR